MAGVRPTARPERPRGIRFAPEARDVSRKPLLADLAQIDFDRPIATIEEIRRYNPQRFEMEQLTAIVFEDREENVCVAYKDLSENEFWVRGHMPGMPLMPGVIMLEAVAQMCSYFVQKHDLPEKVLVYHQLAPSIVRSENEIREHPGVAIVKSVDGIGSRSMKLSTYRKLTAELPEPVHAGFKLFYSEDREFGPLMTPAQVLALRPQPEYVLYE